VSFVPDSFVFQVRRVLVGPQSRRRLFGPSSPALRFDFSPEIQSGQGVKAGPPSSVSDFPLWRRDASSGEGASFRKRRRLVPSYLRPLARFGALGLPVLTASGW
jgi:hypothetical protein